MGRTINKGGRTTRERGQGCGMNKLGATEGWAERDADYAKNRDTEDWSALDVVWGDGETCTPSWQERSSGYVMKEVGRSRAMPVTSHHTSPSHAQTTQP